MAGRWKTHRGDEWWYSDYWCNLGAGFNSAYPGILSIDDVEFKPGQLSERRIHELLWSTQQQFKENKIEIVGDRDLLPILKTLQERGLLEMASSPHTYSKCVPIVRVSPPEKNNEEAKGHSRKKPWWRLW